MNDITEFLTARLDDAEETARSAGESRIAWLTYLRDDGQLHYTTVADGHGGVWVADGKELPEPASVLVVYDTAEVLADIAAKRAIVKEYQRCGPYTQGHSGLSFAVRLLASAYATHPSYRSEWAP